MSVFWAIVAIIISLILVVGIHEAGHALVAHCFGIKIQKISIGFGRTLLQWQGQNGCQWVWALWPLGGYVQLFNTRIIPVPARDYAYCFDKKPVWIRCSVLLAGAVANIIVAWFALTLMFMIGYKQLVPVVARIIPTSIAAQSGLQVDDKVLQVAGKQVMSWREVNMQLIKVLGKPAIHLIVLRKGHEKRITLNNLDEQFKGKRQALLVALGVKPHVSALYIQTINGESIGKSGEKAGRLLIDLLSFLVIVVKQIMTGVIPVSVLLGPLGLFTVMVGSLLQGVSVFLFFIANLSLSVALINLFPLPTLDGGSIIYALIEGVRGRPIAISVEILLHRLIFIAFWILLVQLLVNDLQQYIYMR